jgi:hypothetical protein
MGAYGIDVLDPAVTPRRVAVLLRGLPPAARVGGEEWSVEAELLALLVDHVAGLTYVTLKAHGAKNATKPRPLPRPRSPRHAMSTDVNVRQPAPREAAPGAAKAGSWADAARMLAGLPGMAVSGG